MSNRQFGVVVLLVVVSSLAGGAICNLLLWGAPAVAQVSQSEVRDSEVRDVVTARKFVLVDEDSKERRCWTLLPTGGPGLRLYDAAGRRRVRLSLGCTKEEPVLLLYDAAGALRTGLDAGLLWVGDAAGAPRAFLGVADSGEPYLTLWDAAGQERVTVGCTKTVDKDTGAETKYPESTVTLFNAKGDVLWQAPAGGKNQQGAEA